MPGSRPWERPPAEGREAGRAGIPWLVFTSGGLLALALVVGVATLLSGRSSSSSGGTVYLVDSRTEAYQALMRGKFETAKSIVDEALKRSPSDRELELLRVRILIEWGRLTEAKSHLDAMLKDAKGEEASKPFKAAERAEAWVLASMLYSRMGQPEIAVAYLIKAADARPSDAHLWKLLARLQFALKRYSEALSSAHRSLQLAMTSEDVPNPAGANPARGWAPTATAPEIPDPSRGVVPRPEDHFPTPLRGPR
jgi:Tfp pilus assembly protein PilF